MRPQATRNERTGSAPPTPASCLEVGAVGLAALGTIYLAVRVLMWGFSELLDVLMAVIA